MGMGRHNRILSDRRVVSVSAKAMKAMKVVSVFAKAMKAMTSIGWQEEK